MVLDGIATILWARRSRFVMPVGSRVVFFPLKSTPALGHTEPHIKLAPGYLPGDTAARA